MSNRAEHTRLIKAAAKRLGFEACGISKADFLEEEAPRLEQWLSAGMQGSMQYMEHHFDKRLDPRLLVEGAKSVISLSLNYYSPALQEDKNAPKLSMYAYGEDYHAVIKDKLKALLEIIRTEIGEVNGRGFVDSAPVLDKAWAAKSGLGWLGKNGNLLRKNVGSYFFLAELIVDLELDADAPVAEHCGTCTKCIDACPTQAIVNPYIVDGSKCISYLTIELKEDIPSEFAGQLDNWLFGCDICQDVCPWNRFSKPTTESRFQPKEALLKMNKQEWTELTEELFGQLFQKSAVKRTKYSGLKRNIKFLSKKV